MKDINLGVHKKLDVILNMTILTRFWTILLFSYEIKEDSSCSIILIVTKLIVTILYAYIGCEDCDDYDDLNDYTRF